MSEQERTILQYLENSYTGARMLDDISAMTRIARAIAAFETDSTAGCEYWDTESNYCALYRPAAVPTADLSEYSDKLWKTAYERGKAEADPRKGKWIYQIGMVKCDQCLRAIRRIDCDGLLNFCPNCGARMTEESE